MGYRPPAPGFRWRAIVHRAYSPNQVYALKGQINPAQGKAKRHPGLRGAKRKSPALCKPSPTLPQQDWRRLAERGTADAAIRPRVPLRPGGVALPWAGLICPSGAHRAFPFIRENILPNHPRGFAPGYHPTALQAGSGIRPEHSHLFVRTFAPTTSGVSPRAIVHRAYRPDQVYALKGQINPAQGKAKRHPGLRGAKRKSPALCKPSPTLPQQDWRRLAGRGTADAAIRPRVPLRPGGFALP